jgi:hypothetical protein
MDLIDIASENDFTSYALLKAKFGRKKELRGTCLACQAKIADNLLYCDGECKEDYIYRQNILNNQGRKNG